ncbi:hypothetical protein [Micromonospora sp. NPDC048830]|uniref:hypothetical protein n=1 Tax=Micromonospora sp. NPDC048830 TaxID=3364257 RepID=UPI00371A164E
MQLVNLTPHPVAVYSVDTPDRIEPGSVLPLRVISPSAQHQPARLGQSVVGVDDLGLGIPVEQVAFGTGGGGVTALPEPVEGVFYLVSLVVGLAAVERADLLVPHDTVRDLSGSIIGTRKLARPHRS